MYEYKVELVNKNISVTEVNINILAEEGWRLVGVDTHLLYFEREKQKEKEILNEEEILND